jgi:flagellar basal body-associated protein FliL
MADEEEVEVLEEKKGGLVKILLFVTIALLLIIISVGATLFLSGFFDPKPVVVDEEGNLVTQDIDGEDAEEEEVDPNAPKPIMN